MPRQFVAPIFRLLMLELVDYKADFIKLAWQGRGKSTAAYLRWRSHFEPTTTQGTSASPLKSRILSYTICIMSSELREVME